MLQLLPGSALEIQSDGRNNRGCGPGRENKASLQSMKHLAHSAHQTFQQMAEELTNTGMSSMQSQFKAGTNLVEKNLKI